jgi:hypothetical protein
MQAITKQEKLDMLTIKNHPDIVLMKVTFDDEETAAICLQSHPDENKVAITPIAVMITEQMFERMQPPEDPFGGDDVDN